ncbi:MAG: universal stress protein [Gemmatimonadales bacterium]
MPNTVLAKGRDAAPEAPVHIRKILVPFDFGEAAEHALDFAQKLAPSFGASVEALYVVPYLPNAALPVPELGAVPMAAYAVDELMEDAKRRLHEALAPEDTRHRYLRKTVTIGDPRAQIIAHAATEGVDLIVMGTHGRTGATRFLLGSVAERVVREASCPVLTIH